MIARQQSCVDVIDTAHAEADVNVDVLVLGRNPRPTSGRSAGAAATMPIARASEIALSIVLTPAISGRDARVGARAGSPLGARRARRSEVQPEQLDGVVARQAIALFSPTSR
jgi:hypothetical protein